MAPLPDNSTGVMFFDYTTGSVQHTAQLRFGPGSGPAIVTLFTELALAMTNVLASAWRVLGVRQRAAGAMIALPYASAGTLLGFMPASGVGLDPVNEPREYRWVGRGSTSGRRVTFSLYGVTIGTPPSYRYPAEGGPPSLNEVYSRLMGGYSGLVTVGGDAPIWQPYVNVNYNSYWETEARG